MKKLLLVCLAITLIGTISFSQQNDLRITYYANQGVSGLAGASKVYMYSGAVTSSPSGSWEYIIGSPNLDDGIGQMTSLGNDTWTICIDPEVYYSSGLTPIPTGTPILAIDLFFRNENGTLFGYDYNGTYIVLDMTTNPITSTFTGVATGSCAVGGIEIPKQDFVINNFPNPLKNNTLITYNVKNNAENVEIKIFDVIGQKVRTITDKSHAAGVYKINWNGDNDNGSPLKNGLYFYTLEVNNKVLRTNRVVISR